MNRLPRWARLGLPIATAISLSLAGCTPAEVAEVISVLPPELRPDFKGSDSVSGKGQESPVKPKPNATVTGAAGEAGAPGKMLLAIYLIGSDLEDGGEAHDNARKLHLDGAGTADLNEIRKGYMALSAAQKANLDVFVIFGGARQIGWRGTRVIDIDGIVKDGADGYYGNAPDNTYLQVTPGEDMGAPATFSKFLELVKARKASGNSARLFLDLWDHGGSYGGMGPDAVTENVLGNDKQRDALKAAGIQADIIGYDACLMASAEVVGAVKDHANYLLASEELEPGHGWDYEGVVNVIAKDPNAPVDLIGRGLVDSFIDSRKHKGTNGRTLSLINLKKAGPLLDALHQFGQATSGKLGTAYQGLLDSAGQATPYGSSGSRGDEVAIDLMGFASAVKTQVPEAAAEAEAVVRTLKDAVSYSRHDGTKPGSNGLSIFSLQNLGTYKQQGYNANNAPLGGWFSMVEAFMGRGASDSEAPKLNAAKGYRINQAEGGVTFQVADNTGVEDVYVVHAVQPDPNSDNYVIVNAESEVEVGNNQYLQPDWDGFALHIGDEAGGKMAISTTVEYTEDGYTVVAADGQLNGEEVIFYLMLDPNRQVVDQWATPYEEESDKDQVVDKDQYIVEAGDQVAFYQQVVDIEKDEVRYDLGKAITIQGTADYTWEKVAGTAFYFTTVDDLNGNQENSAVYEVGKDEPVEDAEGGTFDQSDK